MKEHINIYFAIFSTNLRLIIDWSNETYSFHFSTLFVTVGGRFCKPSENIFGSFSFAAKRILEQTSSGI
jgi:hypothetical protein